MNREFLFGDGDIWSKHTARVPRLLSVLLHLTLLIVALIPWTIPSNHLPESLVNIALYVPSHLTLPPVLGGGGGGGRHDTRPASLGKLPRPADRQITPPDPMPAKNADPQLVVEQTVVAPQLASLPNLLLLNVGDPDGIPGPPSPGPGNGYGIGPGNGHGVGEGNGPGVGPGDGGGYGTGSFGLKGGMTAPVLVTQILPEYSEEARKARFEGTVVLDTIVREDGSVQVLHVKRGVGFGLDESAVAAVLKWKFRPGRMNGKAIAVALNIEVRFNLR